MLRNFEEDKRESFEDYKKGLRGGVYEGSYDGDRNSPNDMLATRTKLELIEEINPLKQFPFGNQPDESKIIRVRSNLKPLPPDKDKHIAFPIALFERNEAHPSGEVWIADDGKQIHEVAYTALVVERLESGDLITVEAVSEK